MRVRWVVFIAAALGALANPVVAQTPDTTVAAPVGADQAAPALAFIRIPAGTVVHLELTEALSSRTSQQEQVFGLRLVEPIVVEGREIVPAGAIGGGEVIDAHPSAFGGRQGRLIVSGRFLEINGQRARIRGMQITGAGEDRGNTALAVTMIPYAGVAGIFVHGGEVDIPVGARGTARLAADIVVPLTALEAAPPPEPTQTLQGENQQ